MGILWEFFGNSFGIFWEFFRNFLGILWEFFGNFLEILLEILLEFVWNSFGIRLEFVWNSLGILKCILTQNSRSKSQFEIFSFKKTAFFFFSRLEAEFFLSPCHHARHLQQIHWFKIFCRMYGLAVMLTIPRSSTCLLLIRFFISSNWKPDQCTSP